MVKRNALPLACDTKPDARRVSVIRHLMPMRRTEKRHIFRDPGSTADDSHHAGSWTLRITIRSVRVVTGGVPVGDPLPDISDHVEQPEAVRGVAADGLRAAVGLAAAVRQKIALPGTDFVAPG